MHMSFFALVQVCRIYLWADFIDFIVIILKIPQTSFGKLNFLVEFLKKTAMCSSKLFSFHEFGGISTQLSAMPKARIRCADSVVCGYHVYMDKWDPAIGDKFNADIEVSNQCDQYTVNNRYSVND